VGKVRSFPWGGKRCFTRVGSNLALKDGRKGLPETNTVAHYEDLKINVIIFLNYIAQM
jgi:hypothetical protein